MAQAGDCGGVVAGERARCAADGRRVRERRRIVLIRMRWWQAAQV